MARFVTAAGVLIFSISASTLSAPAPESDRDVKAIVARALEAKGGAANVDKYRAATCNFTLHEEAQGVILSGTSYDQYPDKSVLKATSLNSDTIQFTQVFAGDKGWESANGTTTEMDKETLAAAREEMHANSLADLHGLHAMGVSLSPLGESKVDGRAVVGVNVSCAGHYDVKLFFGKEKALLVKMETRVKDDGKEYTEENFYSDYKNISGVMVPFKISVKRNGKPYLTAEMSDVVLSEKLPDSTFAKP
jgi:zinc protease